VLPKEEFDEQHLPGAIHIPLRKIDPGVRANLAPDRRRGCRPTDCRDGRAPGGTDLPSRGIPPEGSGTRSRHWVGRPRRGQ
jgi:hypothetical protein